MKYNIAIAEDDPFLLSSLDEKLSFFDDFEVKIKARNGEELLEKMEANHHIDVVLMDIQMPKMDGITATGKLKMKYPHIKVIMLTVLDDDNYIFNAIVNGANGYLLKETPPENLQASILEISNGGAPMSPAIASRAIRLLSRAQVPEFSTSPQIGLTNRELEILQQLSKGLGNKQIAENLFISPGTVRKHIENIYSKLQVHNKVEAVQKASKSGMI